MIPRKRVHSDWLGAHVSTSGGVHTAPDRGIRIGASVIQLFTKQPSQWREPILDPETIQAFHENVEASGLRMLISHDSYLIKSGHPGPHAKRKIHNGFHG